MDLVKAIGRLEHSYLVLLHLVLGYLLVAELAKAVLGLTSQLLHVALRLLLKFWRKNIRRQNFNHVILLIFIFLLPHFTNHNLENLLHCFQFIGLTHITLVVFDSVQVLSERRETLLLHRPAFLGVLQ